MKILDLAIKQDDLSNLVNKMYARLIEVDTNINKTVETKQYPISVTILGCF